jgi:hypothetical protein
LIEQPPRAFGRRVGWLCNIYFNRYSLFAVTAEILLAAAEISGSLILAFFKSFLTKLRQKRDILVPHPRNYLTVVKLSRSILPQGQQHDRGLSRWT